MGTSQPYVARLESATVDPRLSTVLRYAAVVAGGIAVAALLRELIKTAGVPK
jgi:predicted transcriptional regulator